MSIKINILKILEEIADERVKLIAVSKTKPVTAIQEAYEAGQRDFGENKVQELTEKQEQLPQDIRWHMIGHLQRNKVKYIAPFVHLIHGVDSFKLLKEINKQGEKIDRKISCLLQMHIAEEESKFGFSEEELLKVLAGEQFNELKNIMVKGLMGMATYTDDKQQIKKEFKSLKTFFDYLKENYQNLPNLYMEELSMGMSGDYLLAVKEGSTMVRVGSAIFGEREKKF